MLYQFNIKVDYFLNLKFQNLWKVNSWYFIYCDLPIFILHWKNFSSVNCLPCCEETIKVSPLLSIFILSTQWMAFFFTLFYISRRKYWFRANFRFPVFDGFTCFGMSWTRFDYFWKMSVCLSVCVTKILWQV